MADARSICIIVQTRGLGGVEVHTLGLIGTLVRKGYGIELISCAPHHYDTSIAEAWRTSVRVVHVGLSIDVDDRESLREWSTVLRSLSSRVLVLPKGACRMGSTPFLRVCRRFFTRMYAIEHQEADPLPPATPRRLFGVIPLGFALWRRRLVWQRRRSAAQFTRTVAVSEAVKRRLVVDWEVPSARIEVIRNGVVSQDFMRDVERGRQWRGRHGVTHGAFVFGMLTRLDRLKAIPVALRAVQALQRRANIADFCLVIAGEGEDADRLKALTDELGIADRVRFVGHTRERVAALSAFDVIVFSSVREGLPLGLLEAMAAGCIPIVTRISGMPEAVNSPDIGWVVPPNEPEALASAMAEVLALDSGQIDAKRRANVERVQREFDLVEAQRRILELMEL